MSQKDNRVKIPEVSEVLLVRKHETRRHKGGKEKQRTKTHHTPPAPLPTSCVRLPSDDPKQTLNDRLTGIKSMNWSLRESIPVMNRVPNNTLTVLKSIYFTRHVPNCTLLAIFTYTIIIKRKFIKIKIRQFT